MREFEALLENFWIIKDQDKELYHEIKDAYSTLKSFIENKLGYRLLINPYLIKMEKLPGRAEAWMGIQQFESPMEYAFFCLLLVFLEDYGQQEQFILSQVTEFIQSTFPGEEKVEWTLYRHRIYLVKVLNLAVEMGLIKVDEGESSHFTTALETEVLYESTGISRYFARNFSRNILSYKKWDDLEQDEWFDIDPDRGAVRRHRVYRRIFLSPAVFSEGAEDPDFLYLKNFRSMLQKDVEDFLDSSLHLHKSCAILMLEGEKNFRETLPDQKVISGIAIQVCTAIRKMLTEGKLTLRDDDTILLSQEQLERIIDDCREQYVKGWSKEFREMSSVKLYNEIISYMSGFLLLERLNDQEFKILPLAGKISGKYPADFGGNK